MVDILREHVYSKGFIQILDKKGKWLAILTQINVYVLIYNYISWTSTVKLISFVC